MALVKILGMKSSPAAPLVVATCAVALALRFLSAAGGAASPGQIYLLAVLACLGIVLTAAYMLWTIQRIFFGPERAEYRDFKEVDQREQVVLWPLAAMALLLGILPSVFVFTFTESTVDSLFRLFALK